MVYLGELMTRTNDPMQSPVFSQGPLPIVKYESTCETFRMMIMIAILMTMVAMVAAQGPVDNVLGTDLETSRVLVVEHQRQQYVPSLHVHVFDDNHDYHVFSPITII